MTIKIVSKNPPTALRFSPYAWAKLLYLRDAGETEIGGFGIAAHEDLLFVEDVQLVRQTCTVVTAEFDDQSVADFFDDQVDAGRQPEQFFRLFMHTHPGISPTPSMTDEETFSRVFGRVDWAVMFILARGGQCYARLRYNVGPGIDVELPVEVDYSRPFDASDALLWQAEYLDHVRRPQRRAVRSTEVADGSEPASREENLEEDLIDDWWRDAWGEYADFGHHEREVHFGDTY